MTRYNPMFQFWGNAIDNEIKHRKFIKEIKLPLYVDFPMAGWMGGQLAKTTLIPERAKSDPNFKQHWFPFDPDNEDGMKLYKENWTYGTTMVVESGGTPLFMNYLMNHHIFVNAVKIAKNLLIGL